MLTNFKNNNTIKSKKRTYLILDGIWETHHMMCRYVRESNITKRQEKRPKANPIKIAMVDSQSSRQCSCNVNSMVLKRILICIPIFNDAFKMSNIAKSFKKKYCVIKIARIRILITQNQLGSFYQKNIRQRAQAQASWI